MRQDGPALGLLLCLSACGNPGAFDAGTTGGTAGTGGQGALVGPCDSDGGCPAGAYCLPSLKQCAYQIGVSVQTGPGNCYLRDPCGTTCLGAPCASDLDCGEALTCDPAGSCCDARTGSCFTLPFGADGGNGPRCPGPLPSPCPAGCAVVNPPHACESCLCPTCPTDAG